MYPSAPYASLQKFSIFSAFALVMALVFTVYNRETTDAPPPPENETHANVVTECGADPSGATDSEPAFERCVQQVTDDNWRGGTVEIPPGEYYLASPVDLDSTARQRIRFVGGGTKATTEIKVGGEVGFLVDRGGLNSFGGTSFERLKFEASNSNATAIRFRMVNHGVIRECDFEGFAVGIELDSNTDNFGSSMDAGYHQVTGGTRFRDNRIAVLVTDSEGGFEMFGGHIVLNQVGDVGIDIRGGWQQRIYGTKFDGRFNGGEGRGTAIRTAGMAAQFFGFQIESAEVGIHLLNGAEQNHFQGFISNGGDGMTAVKVEAGAENNIIPHKKSYLRTNNDPIVDDGANTVQPALVEAGVD